MSTNPRRGAWPYPVRPFNAKVIHECPRYEELNPDRYQHELYMYGRALSAHIYQYPDGQCGMDNEEYGIRVLFCPYCGKPVP